MDVEKGVRVRLRAVKEEKSSCPQFDFPLWEVSVSGNSALHLFFIQIFFTCGGFIYDRLKRIFQPEHPASFVARCPFCTDEIIFYFLLFLFRDQPTERVLIIIPSPSLRQKKYFKYIWRRSCTQRTSFHAIHFANAEAQKMKKWLLNTFIWPFSVSSGIKKKHRQDKR